MHTGVPFGKGVPMGWRALNHIVVMVNAMLSMLPFCVRNVDRMLHYIPPQFNFRYRPR